MAASLDEIQSYDLFQIELEKLMECYFLKLPATKKYLGEKHLVNSLIEYAVFNRYADSLAQLDEKFVQDFYNWYSLITSAEKDIFVTVDDFINFCSRTERK